MSIRIRSFVIILLSALVIIVVSMSSGIAFVNDNIEKSQKEELSLVADVADNFISTEITLLKTKTEQIAQILSVTDENQWADTLIEQAARHSDFVGFSILDKSEGAILATGELPPTEDLLYKDFAKQSFEQQTVISTTISTTTDFGVVFYISTQIPTHPDKIVMVTLPGLHFANRLNNIVIWESGHIFVDDAEGTVISNSREEWVKERNNFIVMAQTNDEYTDVANAIKRGINGETGIAHFSIGGVPRICAFTPITASEEGWFLGIIAPLSESPFRHTTGGLVMIGIVSFLLSLITALVGAKYLERPYIAIEELKDIAEEHSRAKTDFLANMSHEIRTPMNAIIGMTAIGKSASSMSRTHHCLDKIEEASQHLLGVINDILDMSKIEAGKFELSPIEFNFEQMLHQVINVIKFRADEKDQTLLVHIDPKIPEYLVGDNQRFAQVITNLIGNAIKFTPNEGSISLDTKLNNILGNKAKIFVSVTDNGIGVTEEQKAKLFDSFQQADSGTSRKYGGTGLGLSISKSIVEMMEGTIWVDSVPGEGSSFCFTVILDKSERDDEEDLKQNKQLEDLRILVVDNEKTVLEYFEEIFQKYGLHLDTALSGEEALRLVDEGKHYNIYFIDWKMPFINGIELTKEIRKMDSKAEVVLITAAEISEYEEGARDAGINQFLTKPIFPADIETVLSDYVGIKKYSANMSTFEAKGIYDNHRIMIAEDVEINREIMQEILEDTLLEIDFATNGKKAVEMFEASSDKYELIFMDIQMPEMDGYEATRTIRASNKPSAKSIPIVAMTANVFKEDIERCMAAGMNGHIGKPLNIEEVMKALNQHLLKDKNA